MITTENIASHEFIGLSTQITNSSNLQLVGLNGRIIEETKSMFRINTSKGIKSIAKSGNGWKFLIENKNVIVNGADISKRPADRLVRKI